MERIKNFLKTVRSKLFKIDDTPQKIAAGLGLGVFFGVMPAAGPVIALFFAFVFKINRTAALLGSVLTNVWLSIPAFFFSVRIGAAVTGVSYSSIKESWSAMVQNFEWSSMIKLSVFNVIVPVILGYIIVAFIIGTAAYLAVLLVLHRKNKAAILLAAILAVLAVVDAYPAIGRDFVREEYIPEPRLISPRADEVDLTDKDTLLFKWSAHEGNRTRRKYYDFRIYAGTEMLESALIFKKEVGPTTWELEIDSKFFESGKVYTWSLRQVYDVSGKSRRSIQTFKILKMPLPEGAGEAKR